MYQVSTPVFEGPFDLLLQLIERERLDISVISLALVTDQFLAYVAEIEETIKADELADFLVIAARLILIKSRLLLPQLKSSDEEEEEDPAEALARQLREYKRFKQAALALRVIEERGFHCYNRIAPPPELERRLDAGDMTLAELLAAAQAVLVELPELPPIPQGVVVPFTLTIHDQIRLIRQATAGGLPITLRALIRGASYKLEIIVTLLAVLELIKRRQVVVVQDGLFGEIQIAPMPGVEITDEDFENGNGDLTA